MSKAFTYDEYFHPRLIWWMCRWGLQDKEIAAELGIPITMLDDWKAEHPEIKAAMLSGRTYWLDLAESSMHKLVKGYDYDETVIEIDTKGQKPGEKEQAKPSKVRKITKHVPPNPQAIAFMLQNRTIFRLLKDIEKTLPAGFPISALQAPFKKSD